MTLLQFLESEFDLKLPLGNSGADVPRVLAMARRAVRDVPGMKVLNETALSTFSFAKFLMWKDLAERTDALRENRVVRHLIDTPDEAVSINGDQPAFTDKDGMVTPTGIEPVLQP